MPWISGGAQSSIYVDNPELFGFEFNTEFRRYYLVLVVFLLAFFGAQNLVRSRIGRAFIAIRDRDIAAEIIGVNLFRYKLLAFAVSSFYAGVAGALWTYYLRIANYENFVLVVSIEYLAMIIIGRLGQRAGRGLRGHFHQAVPHRPGPHGGEHFGRACSAFHTRTWPIFWPTCSCSCLVL